MKFFDKSLNYELCKHVNPSDLPLDFQDGLFAQAVLLVHHLSLNLLLNRFKVCLLQKVLQHDNSVSVSKSQHLSYLVVEQDNFCSIFPNVEVIAADFSDLGVLKVALGHHHVDLVGAQLLLV